MKTKIVKKIALIGGSFNPIHNSHIKIIKHILKNKIVNEVWIIPCQKHAFDKNFASAKDRIKMIKHAVKDIDNIKICKIELKTKRKNYTIDTLRKLRRKYKNNFIFVIGSDILYEIKKWHDYKQLLKETEFILFKRKNYKIKSIKGLKLLNIINAKEDSISSTEIRNKIKQRKSISKLVPNQVENYIKKNKLYGWID